MRETARIIKTTILICACFVWFAGAGTERGRPREKRTSTWDLIRKQRIQNTKVAESSAEEHRSTKPQGKERIIHFPEEKSLGTLSVQDEGAIRKIETYRHWIDGTEWKDIGEAKGDVTIPAGKRLGLTISPKEWKDLSPLSDLRPDDIYSLGFRSTKEGSKLDDRCMSYIVHLSGLKILMLSNTNISDKGLKLIGNLNSLERLSAPRRLTDAGLAQVAHLSSLKALYIYDQSLTNAGLAHLAQLELLEELDLVGSGRLNDAGLVHLSKVPRLQYLMLRGKNFTDDGMIHIKDCSSLRILHLGNLTQLTDAAIVQLSHMSALERLSLHWNENITDASILYLTKLNSLKMLDIDNSQITDEGLARLVQIKSLENLTLPHSITDAGIEHIAKLHNLKYLWVGSRSWSPLTDKSLSYISTLGNIEELCVGGTGISDEGMKHIAKLTNLKSLSIFMANQLTNKGLAKLSGLKSLTNFMLGESARVSFSGLNSLNNLKNLNNLSLYDIRQDNFTMDISGLTELKDLIITLHKERNGRSKVSNSFKNEDWACLANLTKLKRLQITGVGINNEGVKHLSGLTNLEYLNIICPGESKINDHALKYLRNMNKLNRLIIKDGHFTDKALDYLVDLPSLSWLELASDFAFSKKAIRNFRQKNPKITRLQLIP